MKQKKWGGELYKKFCVYMKNNIVYGNEYFARVMDHKYVESFLDGNIWINSLINYLKIKENIDDSYNNGFRGDFFENSVASIRDLSKSMFSNCHGIEGSFAKQVNLDRNLSSINTLCFYLYKIDLENGLILPDKQMAQFGDSVVIICNPEEFFRRLTKAIINIYPDAYIMLNTVEYYDEGENQAKLNPLFNKRLDYSYQNELRYAVSKYGNPLDVEVCKNNRNNNIPIKINIGSIKDIAFSISSDMFLSTFIYSWQNSTESEQEKNITTKKLFSNAKQFKDKYEPDCIPTTVFFLYEGFDTVDYKNPGLRCLTKSLARDLDNPPRSGFGID